MAPAGGPETFDAVERGYVVAPADAALWTPSSVAAPRRAGTVEAVLVAPAAETAMVTLEGAMARAGRGLGATGTSISAARSRTRTIAATT